ncbi:hypothetical protein MMC13_006744 [Lambiella insularis]|nr:hypothetical protein [Lambiella insularis]
MHGNYTIYPSTWTGQVVPGGPNMTFTHNQFAEITNQILMVNPAYDFAGSTVHEAHNRTASTRAPVFNVSESSLVARNAIKPPNCYCPGFDYAPNINAIYNLISILNYNLGIPVPSGPRACVEVACSANSGIYLCNDNPYPISPSLIYILNNYAADIANTCDAGLEVIGQEFDTDSYNVIVGWCGEDFNPYSGCQNPDCD